MGPSDKTQGRLSITPLHGEEEARVCARLMSTSEPWITLGRNFETSLTIVKDPTREVYVARGENGVAGFVILCLTGAFVGYIQTVCVDPHHRGQGLGTKLVEFAEEKILRVSPNVFMCVSSFNDGARRLYQRMGYTAIGELTDLSFRDTRRFCFGKRWVLSPTSASPAESMARWRAPR